MNEDRDAAGRIEQQLAALGRDLGARLERLEERVASLAEELGGRERAESAERRLRELGEQTDYLIEALSQARRWLHEREQKGE